MKQQTSDVISATVDFIESQKEQYPKKVAECQVETNNNNNNSSSTPTSVENDAGYMTSSNDSLHAEASSPTEDDSTSSWKLNIPPKLSNLSDEEMLRILKEARVEIERVPKEERRKWLIDKFTEYYGEAMPASLIELLASHFFDGDSGIVDVKPNWLDMDKFRRGQKLAMDNLFGVFYADIMSLFTVFSFEDGLKPLILTNASSTPYTAFKRYLSTGSRVQNWYSSDPWTPGTPAYNDIRTVRRLHAMVRKKIQEMPHEEYDEKTSIKQAWCPAWNDTRRDMESTCPAPKPGQCPYTVAGNFPELKDKKLSQGEMAATQFAFVGLLILHPKFFGIHDATDEDLEAFCHMWRGLGFLLGIEDEFNFCRGTLEEVRTRSRDFLEYWVKPNFRVVSPEWEHMMRCVVEGLQYYFPGSTYETCLLDLAEIMNLHMPRMYNSMSYSVWIRHNVIRFFFNQGAKFSGLRSFMNRQLLAALEKARNYDEQKHKELKERSMKTIDAYLMKTKRNEISMEQSSD